MKYFFVFLATFILFGFSHAQSWSNSQLITANTAANAPGLSTEEKNVILYQRIAIAPTAFPAQPLDITDHVVREPTWTGDDLFVMSPKPN